MRFKKFACYIIALLMLLIIILGIVSIDKYSHTVDIKNEKKLTNFIEKIDKVNDISIVKQSDYKELHCILYDLSGSIRLFILEKSIIPNRYNYYGGVRGNNSFGTYNSADDKGALIIVYGNNSTSQAYTYSMKNGSITYTEDIHNIDYVLRVFRIPDSYNMSSNLYLFDSNDNLIHEY